MQETDVVLERKLAQGGEGEVMLAIETGGRDRGNSFPVLVASVCISPVTRQSHDIDSSQITIA